MSRIKTLPYTQLYMLSTPIYIIVWVVLDDKAVRAWNEGRWKGFWREG